jgi:hypothetical protein
MSAALFSLAASNAASPQGGGHEGLSFVVIPWRGH